MEKLINKAKKYNKYILMFIVLIALFGVAVFFIDTKCNIIYKACDGYIYRDLYSAFIIILPFSKTVLKPM